MSNKTSISFLLSCRQAGSQTGIQTNRQTSRQQKNKFTDLPSISLNIVKGVWGREGVFFKNKKPTIIYIFIKIIKFQTITHLIVCKMGEKKILGRLACLLILARMAVLQGKFTEQVSEQASKQACSVARLVAR